ncbi:MAG: hypothetical protein Wins2KO_11730 [Winogradskyella sp.]
MIGGVLTGLAIMALQCLFIDRIIKRRDRKKDQLMWTPFRILFFQSIYDHHNQLMDIYNEFITRMNSLFINIRNKKVLTLSEIEELDNIIISCENQLLSSDKSFHNVIQTVSASLQPDAAFYCSESLYFSYLLSSYYREIHKSINELKKLDNLDDNAGSSKFLNKIEGKTMGLKVVIETRLKNFIENFSDSLWRTEKLYYHKGEVMEERDYKLSLKTERAIQELNNTPKTDKQKDFFGRKTNLI